MLLQFHFKLKGYFTMKIPKEVFDATIKTYILGRLIDKCQQILTPDLIDELAFHIVKDVLMIIEQNSS